MITPNGGVFGRNPKFNNVTVDGNLIIPRGTIAQRPGTPAAGMIRHNTTSSRLEYYNGTAWQTFQPETLEVEYLVVAGGGGGGAVNAFVGGGGGAGGFRTNVGGTALSLASGTSYTVTVGAGGAGSSGIASGTNGSNSVFASITSAGGGGGGTLNVAREVAGGARDGGSGGGGGGSTNAGTGGFGDVPDVTPDQGTSGGAINSAGLQYSGGGGGGHSQAGANGVAGTGGGKGGDGTASTISGDSVTYAGGGGGGSSYNTGGVAYAGGAGGAGGGGKGGGNNSTSVAGSANTGGGGGGGHYETLPTPIVSVGRAGGSGIVIVRYLGAQRATGGTVTTAGGYTIHEFKTSGTFALVA